MGQGTFVASNTILRAAPELRIALGNQTNAQDNIIVRSREDSSTVGNETSLAHHAIVRDSQVGDFVFIGFNAEVSNSTVGNGAFILHGSRVDGVTLAENAFVNVGEAVTDQATADALPSSEEATEEFRREVLDVNASSPSPI